MQKYDERTLKIKVGELIAQKRRANKMSQETLAEKLDIHIRTMVRLNMESRSQRLILSVN